MAASVRSCLTRVVYSWHQRLCINTASPMVKRYQSTTISSETESRSSLAKVQKISRAMQTYLEKTAQYENMMAEHVTEYELGKRYLANIMDADPDSFSQQDIDEAIQYLLPSGLFAPRARPMMKPPDQIFPKRKEAEFDASGRPYHYLFYTGLPNYYDLLNVIGNKTQTLYSMSRVSSLDRSFLNGSEWLSQSALQSKIIEQISEQQYTRFVRLISRLADHPMALKEKDFIMQYRVNLTGGQGLVKLPDILTDTDTGRRYVKVKGTRKTASVELTVWEHGTGKVNLNGKGIEYFKGVHEREQVMSPLAFVQKIGSVDFEGTISGGGRPSQAGAVRYALSLALAAFEDPDTQERMRQVGLLTRDPRRRERHKPGQRGAREKKTWKKR